jgi:hypothetical protein
MSQVYTSFSLLAQVSITRRGIANRAPPREAPINALIVDMESRAKLTSHLMSDFVTYGATESSGFARVALPPSFTSNEIALLARDFSA